MGKQERNYGIDLLRMLLMYMVCLLHILGQGGILKACEVGSVRYAMFWFMEVCAYCAVDGFAMISGYTASNRPNQYSKLVGMWFQAWFYSFVLTVILQAAGVGNPLKTKDYLKLLVPVMSGSFWYFTAYFALFLALPALNGFIFSLDEKQSRKAFIVLLFLFSLTALHNEAFETNRGYSPLWLMVLYCMGAFAKRSHLFEKKHTVLLMFCLLFNSLLSLGHFLTYEKRLLISYVSPTIVLNGVILVVLFSRLRLKGTVIRKISPLVFGVYLFQMNRVVWGTVLKGSVVFAAEQSLIRGAATAVAYAMLLFTVGIAVEWVRSSLEKLFKMNRVYQAIAAGIDKLLDKLSLTLH